MRKTIRDLLIFMLAGLLVLVVIETLVRSWDVYTGNLITPKVKAAFHAQGSRLHPFLEYTSHPNIDRVVSTATGAKFHVKTNSHGFRTHEFYPKIPGQFRILLLGDSFAFGNNVDDPGKLASVIERQARKNISPDIEVISLGIASYSAVRYSVLADIYFDFLEPDIVIVAVDQSDFEEDRARIDEYVLRDDGSPRYLKHAGEIQQRIRAATAVQLAVDTNRKLVVVPRTNSLTQSALFQLQLGFSLIRRAMTFLEFVGGGSDDPDAWRQAQYPVVTYQQLIKQFGSPIPSNEVDALAGDTILYGLPGAIDRYSPTLTALGHVRDVCNERGTKLYLSSYPYPWMVSIDSAVPYQLKYFGNRVFDFRENRVHPQLLDAYSDKLSLPHLNAYPVFEQSKEDNYGQIDQHFNAKGYALYGKFLYDAIEGDVRGLIDAR
jgi:hypothetical protein